MWICTDAFDGNKLPDTYFHKGQTLDDFTLLTFFLLYSDFTTDQLHMQMIASNISRRICKKGEGAQKKVKSTRLYEQQPLLPSTKNFASVVPGVSTGLANCRV